MIRKIEEIIKSYENGNKNILTPDFTWGGAKVIVCYPDDQRISVHQEQETLVFDSYGHHYESIQFVVSKYAIEISGIFYLVKDVFSEILDYSNKYYFYGIIAIEANNYLSKLGDNLDIIPHLLKFCLRIAVQIEGKQYFAYGANMDPNHMKTLCPKSFFVKNHKLMGYQFIINSHGLATLLPSKTDFVFGSLYFLHPDDIKNIDAYEGIAYNLYYKKSINLSEVENEECFIYLANDTKWGYNNDPYLQKIIETAKKFNFPTSYIQHLKSFNSLKED